MLKIDIWSDIACPFCYIGKRRLEEGISKFQYSNQVEVEYKSFLLAPDAPIDNDKDIHTIIAEKYGLTYKAAKANNDQITEQAKTLGLTYDFDRLKPTNTLDAHRLIHFAKQHGKMEAMTERLLKAYFTEGLHIGNHETLVMLAGEIGLDHEETMNILKDGTFLSEVKEDLKEGEMLGIHSVPFFVFNGKYAVSGAQSPDVFLEVLEKVWQESPVEVLSTSDKDDCSDGSCKL